jgi:hypothetical protein
MTHHKIVAQAFDYFYSKVYRGKHFRLDLTNQRHLTQIDNFAKMIARHFQLPEIGINSLLTYLSFAFSYWHDKKTKRDISLGWIIGKKTFTRWIERKDGSDFYTEKFLREYGVDISLIHQQLAESQVTQDIDAAEEIEKERFEGSARLYHCIQTTTLYHHKSEICLLCCNKVSCKKFLKRVSFSTYRNRGYVK